MFGFPPKVLVSIRKRMKNVVTYLPSDDYDDLYKLVKEKKMYTETFNGDKVETKMWIQDGKLMSQMKGDLRIKQIKPISKLDISELTPTSGFAKSVSYLVKEKGVPLEVANGLLLQMYHQMGIPKSVEVPQKILDSVKKV